MRSVVIPYCGSCGWLMLRPADDHRFINCGNKKCEEYHVVYHPPTIPLRCVQEGKPDLRLVGSAIVSIKECLHHAKRTRQGFFIDGVFASGDEVLLMTLLDLNIAIERGTLYRRSPK